MDVEKILQAVRGYMPVKQTADAGDIILVGIPSGVFYGVIDSIDPDHKKNWYTLKFKLLILPPVEMAWKLRMPQICGELFTMGGEPRFVLPVDVRGAAAPDTGEQEPQEPAKQGRGRFALVKGGAG